ncbi:MAG: ABC transporter ATP-binding protein [Caldilineaceae bacterium]|nr:ABC transporter ATP-binding protein [Caldilineaceae bacterium]
MTTLAIHNLSVAYWPERNLAPTVALHQIDLHVASGEFIAVVGPSGCGKSSLLHAIAGLLPPVSGEMRLDDQVINGPGQERALVFQAPALLPWRTVHANVAYGLELRGLARREAYQRAQPFITLVGLQGFEASYPRELSGGMQQRANLARALAVQPKLLLLDEPLSALDAQTREVMQVELQRIWLESQCSALYVTHQIDEAIFLADKVVVLSARPGQIQQIIPVDFPRPRRFAIKQHPTFAALTAQIWQLLQLDQSFRTTERREGRRHAELA